MWISQLPLHNGRHSHRASLQVQNSIAKDAKSEQQLFTRYQIFYQNGGRSGEISRSHGPRHSH